MDEVFVSATDDVVVGDGDGVNAAAAGLKNVNAFQRTDVPDLTKTETRGESGGRMGENKHLS